MVYFHSKNLNLGIFWRALEWKMLEHILWPFGMFYAIWYIISCFGMFYQEKSGPRACIALLFVPHSINRGGVEECIQWLTFAQQQSVVHLEVTGSPSSCRRSCFSAETGSEKVETPFARTTSETRVNLFSEDLRVDPRWV
jgi:hypothetical protein